MTHLTALARFVEPRHDVVSTAELRSLDFTKDAIKWLVRDERIFPLYRGVYVVGRRTITREGRWMAATLAAPKDSALGHVSAAVLWELLSYESGWPHVVVPSGRSNRGRKGIVTHRSLDITEEEVEIRDSIRVTSVLRTLTDLSRCRLPDRPLNAAVRQAARIHHADLQQLRGLPRLDKIVRLFDPLIGMTESDFEAIFFEMCRRNRLPVPEPQVKFGNFRADFVFEEAQLAIECQSRKWHANDVNFVTDKQKERVIKAAGYELLPFTWAEVVYEPAVVAAEIRAALARRAHLGASSRT